MYEKARAALYALAAAVNVLGIAFGWWSEPQGAAILGVVSALLLVLAFVNVPAVHAWLRPTPVDDDGN